MKAILAAVLGLTACATMSSPSGNGTAEPQAGACAPATVSGTAIVYTSPDDTSQQVAKLSDRSRVCADAEIINSAGADLPVERPVASGDALVVALMLTGTSAGAIARK